MKYRLMSLCGICAIGIFIAAVPRLAFAVGDGSIVVNVKQELGANLAGATVGFSCAGGTFTNMSTTTDVNGIASTSAVTIPAGANCSDTKGIDIRITKTGYVTTILASTTAPNYTYLLAAYNNYNVTNVPFGLKVTVTDELGNAVTPSTESNYGTTATTSANGNILYWADPTPGTAKPLDIRAPGYVFATSTNVGFASVTTSAASQVSITMANTTACSTAISATASCKGLQTMLKVVSMLNELSGNLMPTSVSPFTFGTGLTLYRQTYSGGAWYIAASSTAAGGTLTAASTGYQSQGIPSLITSTTSQKLVEWGDSTSRDWNGSAFPFALKVTVLAPGVTTLTGAAVTAGNAYSVSCTGISTSGVYYCVIPPTDTGTSASAVKTGYVSGTAAYTARTADADAQSTVTVTMSALGPNIGLGGGNSVGGGGGTFITVPVVAPVVASVCPAGYTCRLASATSATPATTPAASPARPSTAGVSATFTARLSTGSNSKDVERLQTLLASDHSVYPEGTITGYFGSLTRKAVQSFQVKYGVAGPGVEGYGSVGPLTRAKLLEVFGSR